MMLKAGSGIGLTGGGMNRGVTGGKAVRVISYVERFGSEFSGRTSAEVPSEQFTFVVVVPGVL